MCQHFLVTLFRVLRLVNAYNLDLRELVQTIQAAHVLTIRACLATEALCIGTVLDRQVFLVEDYVTVDIRHRHFGCGNQVEVIHFAMIHLSFLVGQLSCTITGSLVYHRWWHDLCIASLVSLCQEEIDEGSLQLGTLTDIHRETGTGNLHTQVEVNKIVLLSKFPVGQGIGNTQ